MNAYLLLGFVPLPVIALMIFFRAIGQTSEGYEDESGFHYKSSQPPTEPN
jgi:hypothetical protein